MSLSLLLAGCGGSDTTTVINQTTTVTAPAAEPTVVIPDVIGDDAFEAQRLLEAQNLRVRTKLTYQYDALIQIGQVADQEPAASTSVPEFTVVTLFVAAGE